MRFLLDENFPLALYRRLHREGEDVEHLITSGRRGLPDSAILDRLRNEPDLVLLTQDDDFLDESGLRGRVIVSRVRQSRKIAERVEVWTAALERFVAEEPPGDVFELLDDGTLVPREIVGSADD